MKWLLFIFFYAPLFLNILNTQAFIGKFVSVPLSQAFAYGSLGLLLVGVALILKNTGRFNPIIKTWILFYVCYYAFGLVANILQNTEPPILKTLVEFIYFLSFAFLLSIPQYIKPVALTLTYGLFISCIILIIFNYLNFSMDIEGIYEYKLERAGGVYGDANNAAVACILSFIFIKNIVIPKNKIEKIFKISALIISLYGFLLTFSKTGFLVFALVLGFTFHTFFNRRRILIAIVTIPIALFSVITWGLNSDKLSKIQKERLNNLIDLVTLQTDRVDFSGRDVLLQNMLNYVNENPILGNGINFSNEIRGHNTIIGVWADSGIITFLVFLILLILYFKRSMISSSKIKFFSLAILTTLCVYMLSLQTIINQGNLMVVFVFLGYLLYKKEDSEQSIFNY